MFETTHGFFFFLFFSLILLFLCSPRLPMIERPVEKIKEVLEQKILPSKKKKVVLLRSKQKEDQPYELQPDPRVYQNQPELKQPRFIEEPPLQPHPPMPLVHSPQQQQQEPPAVQELPGLPEHPYPMTPEEQPNEPIPFGDDVGCPL